MKKNISSFGSTVLSREQMKGVKGGTEDSEPGEGGSYWYKCCDNSEPFLNCNTCASEQTCGTGKKQVGC